MRRCYFSKNYKGLGNGGNKAKTDMEKIMDGLGFVNVGAKQTLHHSNIKGYLLTLGGVVRSLFAIRKGDILVMQYPLKKYYSFICRIAHLKGAKVITLIHDLGSFRRKKLTKDKERKRLSNTDYIIALSPRMKDWLINDGYTQPIGILEVWDYLADRQPRERTLQNPLEILYAGVLSAKKHSFIYKFDKTMKPGNYNFTIYGGGFNQDDIVHKDRFDNKGFMESDDIISTTTGHFGMVWYGHSVDKIDGAYGEWLQLTIPHKTSLYVRCHMPVIVWSKAAQASFVRQHGIGICLDSLEELDSKLASLTVEEYNAMKNNTIKLSKQLSEGYYFTQAYLEAEKYLIGEK